MPKNREIVTNFKKGYDDTPNSISDNVYNKALDFATVIDVDLSCENLITENDNIIFDFGNDDDYVYVDIENSTITLQCNHPSGYVSFHGFDINNKTHIMLFNELYKEVINAIKQR